MITADGCWADYRADISVMRGRPCLFLDRDGVLIEDTGYPHDPAAITLIPETLDLVRFAKARGFAAGIVSNQSGIGRGTFGWEAFAAVQAVIDAALATRGERFDFVLACPFLAEAPLARFRHDRHPWRKPAPGMLTAAGAMLGFDLPGSVMVGDRASDMAAAAAAGVRRRVLLGGTPPPDPTGGWEAVHRGGLSDWFRRAVAREPLQR